jgi:hypothetical protein
MDHALWLPFPISAQVGKQDDLDKFNVGYPILRSLFLGLWHTPFSFTLASGISSPRPTQLITSKF